VVDEYGQIWLLTQEVHMSFEHVLVFIHESWIV
jgi:hypothetical protein